MKRAFVYLISGLVVLLAFNAKAERYKYEKNNKRGGSGGGQVAANCTPATAASELNINNTRALIQSGGDMWWDFNRSRYEIPQGSDRTSLFAGSLWLAGQDVSGQFKVAALRFRQVGNDYWTGPLSTIDAEIDPQTCRDYDRHWETTRSMVQEFAAWYDAGLDDQLFGTNTQDELFPGYTVPPVIQEWPGNGRNFNPYNEDPQLAPYFDRNGDGQYSHQDGDYPGYVLSGKSDCSRRVKDLYGDQNLWWVFNDKGNVHTESSGLAIGMEIRAQAFAFSTTDEVNNMTFYNYELINRSTFELRETYFGQWVDGDLGNPQDDYVGCDVRRGLGYFYNGDEEDEDAQGNIGYGVNPPAIGVDFFQGPFQANDNVDNCLCVDYASALEDDGIVYAGQGAGYGDTIVDNERYGMRKFLYHINQAGPTGDPNIASDYYNMLRGIWRDGTNMSFGGTGYDPGNASAIPASYMFPADTDPLNWGTDGVEPSAADVPWTEVSAGNPPGDRRFVQSSGPFTLGPGAVNNITVGVVWMQAGAGGRLASVELMRKADDKTQALFDSCFEILDGPDAPDVTVQELDQEIILMLTNPLGSNNFQEQFTAVDPFLAAPDSVDTDGDGNVDVALTNEEKQRYGTYTFEGYQIYQLADGSVGTSDLTDPDKARLVAQVDLANDVERIINYEFDPTLEADIPTLKVDGANQGIDHTFRVTEDLFSTGDARLVNHKTYYFMAIAYAYNAFGEDFGALEFLPDLYNPSDASSLDGQKLPYLPSRKSPSGPVKVVTAIPHNTNVEMGGVTLNAQYGDGVELIRCEGRGNGGNSLDISQESLDQLWEKGNATGQWTLDSVIYEPGSGPVNVKVVDPLAVTGGNFTIKFEDVEGLGNLQELTWKLYGGDLEDTVTSDQAVWLDNEQIVFDLGLSFTLNYGYPPFNDIVRPDGDEPLDPLNGFLGFEVSYEDETDQWLFGLPDADSDPSENWIKSGDFIAPDPLEGAKDPAEDDHFNNFSASEPDDDNVSLDERQSFENVAFRTWAPYALTSYDTAHPIPMFATSGAVNANFSETIIRRNDFSLTPSVNVYITSDKSKWSRVPVFEAQDNGILSEGGSVRGELRMGLSVDKEGRNQLDPEANLDEITFGGSQTLDDRFNNLSAEDLEYFADLGFTSEDSLRDLSFGMGWFPGYAIDVETGERLNMAFSEDSWLGSENGNDMVWNPTSTLRANLFAETRFGGKHMVYVYRHNIDQSDIIDVGSGGSVAIDPDDIMPAYDGGTFIFDRLYNYDHTAQNVLVDPETEGYRNYMSVARAGAWVGYTMLAENHQLFGDNENDVVIKLRATKPYNYYASKDIEEDPATLDISDRSNVYYVYKGSLTTEVFVDDTGSTTSTETITAGNIFRPASTTYQAVSDNVSVVKTVNNGLPLYRFNTDNVKRTLDPKVAEDALEEIEVVPNPYYAYSEYEGGRLEYLVKVVNLPVTCTVTIYNVNGTLVRTFEKDDETITSVDWDLKNQDGIIIASGVYLIHVEAPGIGERVLKWFGVLRPLDLNSF